MVAAETLIEDWAPGGEVVPTDFTHKVPKMLPVEKEPIHSEELCFTPSGSGGVLSEEVWRGVEEGGDDSGQ